MRTAMDLYLVSILMGNFVINFDVIDRAMADRLQILEDRKPVLRKVTLKLY